MVLEPPDNVAVSCTGVPTVVDDAGVPEESLTTVTIDRVAFADEDRTVRV